MTTNISFPIESTLKSVTDPIAAAAEKNFFGNSGRIQMVPSNMCNYTNGGHPDGRLVVNGMISIGTAAVDSCAKAMGDIPPTWAARDLAIHELGHTVYQQRDFENQPGDNAPMSAKVDWCLTREAEATTFSFEVGFQNHANGGNLHVPGTDSTPDLYNTMLAGLPGFNPNSSQSELKAIALAKSIFAADPKYVAFCSNPKNWIVPKYIPPVDTSNPAGGAGSGGGGAGGGGYAPEPGGYWQEVPPAESSNAVTPTSVPGTHIELVGLAPTITTVHG